MNYFIRLLILKPSDREAHLLFGYALPDKYNEPRPWASGEIGKRLQLYQVSCVMREEDFAAFEKSLVQKEPIALQVKGENFSFAGGFTKRPDVVRYPKRDFFHENESLLKSLSLVREYWNLDKEWLFQEIRAVYDGCEPKAQREKVRGILRVLSEETGISFLQDAAERLGNIEIYQPSDYQDSFSWEMEKEEEKLLLKKKAMVEEELVVNCILENADRVVFNQTVTWAPEEQLLEFSPEEVITQIQISIWRQSDGKLIYFDGGTLARQFVFTTHLMSGRYYVIHDRWSEQLRKTFGGNPEQLKKLEKIQQIKKNEQPMVSRVGDFVSDPWNTAKDTARRLAGAYKSGAGKGAFCKKIGEGECELDSFCKVAEYLNESGVEQVILVDPYFSIRAMEKLLARIENKALKLEIMTSLSSIDPDEEVMAAEQPDYMAQVRAFLKNNSTIIHPHLKILNVTFNEKTAIHDRYLLRLKKDGSMDGYLLSNSLNAAGKNYSFVTAYMDQDVVYEVLDYVRQITDEEIQAKQPKKKRLQIETLWDTFKEQPASKVTEPVSCPKWEVVMKAEMAEEKKFTMNDFFGEGWNDTEEHAMENLARFCWYLYHSNELSAEEGVRWMREGGMDSGNMIALCRKLAAELEEEEACYEEQIRERKYWGCSVIRRSLDENRQKEVVINPQYSMEEFLHIFYAVNGYVKCLYEVLFEFSAKELIGLMQELHSPMAFEVLLLNMYGDKYRMDIYETLQKSNILWLRRFSYYYFNQVLKKRLEQGEEYLEPQVAEYLKQHKETAVYQYACWIQKISFALNGMQRHARRDADKQRRLEEVMEHCFKSLSEICNSEAKFDHKKFSEFFDGPNKAINCENISYLYSIIENAEQRKWLEEKVLLLIEEKWKKKEMFYSHTDYEVTYWAAFMAYRRFGTDVQELKRGMKLEKKDLYDALRPDLYDIAYKRWNQAVELVMEQLLFLKDYESFWTDEEKNTGNYKLLMEHVHELMRVKSQCDRWYDNANLVENVFGG